MRRYSRGHVTYVLPILLQQRDEEVDAHLHVLEDLLLLHTQVANGNTHAKHLFQLELDCGLGLINLGLKGFLVRHQSWKLSCRRLPSKNKSNNNVENNSSVTIIVQKIAMYASLHHTLRST